MEDTNQHLTQPDEDSNRAIFDQRGQKVETQVNVGGDLIVRSRASDDLPPSAPVGQPPQSPPPPGAQPPVPMEPKRPAQWWKNPLVRWFAGGVAASTVVIVPLFGWLRCLIEYRLTEAAIALIALLVAGVATAFSKLLSAEIRKRLLSLYAGISIVLIAGVGLALASPPPSEDDCFPPPPPTPTLTPTPTATWTPTSTATSTPTPTPSTTPTSTPAIVPPGTAIAQLIRRESEAVVAEDMETIQAIFAPEAVRINGPNGQPVNAIEDYEGVFSTLRFLQAQHANVAIAVKGDAATATSDSCGSFIVESTDQKIDYHGPQSDRWEFRQRPDGTWLITSLTFSLESDAPDHRYFFEDGTNGCWAVRYDAGVPQGEIPVFTSTLSYGGAGSLQFSFETSKTAEHRGQMIVYNMPFAGQASAFVYAPPKPPADLEAGFFAMDFDGRPYNYHPPTRFFRLTPGQWTQIAWSVDVSGWARPLHLIGIEVRRVGGGDYRGYILVDDVYFKSR